MSCSPLPLRIYLSLTPEALELLDVLQSESLGYQDGPFGPSGDFLGIGFWISLCGSGPKWFFWLCSMRELNSSWKLSILHSHHNITSNPTLGYFSAYSISSTDWFHMSITTGASVFSPALLAIYPFSFGHPIWTNNTRFVHFLNFFLSFPYFFTSTTRVSSCFLPQPQPPSPSSFIFNYVWNYACLSLAFVKPKSCHQCILAVTAKLYNHHLFFFHTLLVSLFNFFFRIPSLCLSSFLILSLLYSFFFSFSFVPAPSCSLLFSSS